MRRLVLITAGLLVLTISGLALARGLDNARSVKSVAGTFSATTVTGSQTRSCTTVDGKTIVWTKATYTVKDHVVTFTVTAYGGEAPNGAAEKTGEVFAFHWSKFKDQLQLSAVKGQISPENFTSKPWRRVGDVR